MCLGDCIIPVSNYHFQVLPQGQVGERKGKMSQVQRKGGERGEKRFPARWEAGRVRAFSKLKLQQYLSLLQFSF